MNQFVKPILAILFLMPLVGAAEQQHRVAEYEVHYILKLGGAKVGNSYGKLTKVDTDRYESIQKLEPKLLLRLTGERKSTQKSSIKIDGSGQVLTEKYIIEFKRGKSQGAEFDWTNRSITLLDGEVKPMPEHHVLEWGSWYMNLMSTGLAELPGTRITIVSRHGILEYEYGPLEEEVIELGSKLFTTKRITLLQTDKKKEGFTLWLSPEHNNLPVHLQRHKSGVTVNIELKSLDLKL